MKYEDFVIQIRTGPQGDLEAAVLESPEGQGKSVFRNPLAAPDGETVTAEPREYAKRASLVTARAKPEEIGGQLFDALFSGNVGLLYQRSLGRVGSDGLRIKLRLDLDDGAAARLHRLPWELLYQPDHREFLALSRRTPVVRYLEVPRPDAHCAPPSRLRILAVVSSPQDLQPLDLEKEYRQIEEICAKDAGLEVARLPQATAAALRHELWQAQEAGTPFHVLHYMGHGDFDDSGQGLLCFETQERRCAPLRGVELATQLGDFPELRLAFLNACDSAEASAETDPFAGVATALVMGGILAVIAMRRRISDPQAIAFSAAFYQHLAAGDPVDAAVGEGRLAMSRTDPRTAEWSIPALFMRSRDGRLFARRSKLGKYLEGLRKLFEETFHTHLVRPDRVYVPQFASARAEEPTSEVRLLDVMHDFWQGRRRRVACLGNYGMGKTYLAWRAIREQMDRFEESEEARLPIIFPLWKFLYELAARIEGRQDIVEQIRRYVIALGHPEIDRKALLRLIEDGKTGIILDGLDELKIPRGVSWKTVLEPLFEIDGLHVCVTSRTAYVADVERDLDGFEVFDVAEWGEREWDQYLDYSQDALRQVGGKEKFLALVADRPQLAQLTTRPLWCYMIVTVADDVPGFQDLARSGLYQRFLDHAIQRRAPATIILSLPWRYCSMERFAEVCLREGRSSLHERRLVRMLSELFESIGDQELNEYLTKEARTYAFLNCEEARYYNFGHTSIADYFVATGVVRGWIAEVTGYDSGPKEHVPRSPLVTDRRLSKDQVSFVAGVLREEWITRALAMIPEDAKFAEVRAELNDHFRRRLSEQRPAEEKTNVLRIYLRLLRHRQGSRPFLQGLKLESVDLSGLNLEGCDFKDADFNEANLSEARCGGSSFAGCSFFGATVDGTDFTDADLEGADFAGIEPPRTPMILAGVKNVDLARMTDRERKFFRH